MPMVFDLHEVCAKAAIYNETGTKVLVMVYSGGVAYGLPGGHLDAGELPLEAMQRELVEELGTTADFHLEPKDFFNRDDSEPTPRLILGYTGVIAEQSDFVFESHDIDEHAVWMTREEFDRTPIAAGYRAFAERYWPATR